MDDKASISVIIPVYNGEQYLVEAIESVLAQTYPPREIIVVDDGSTDRSAAAALQFSMVRYCYQSNGGAASARNHGVKLSQGELLAFLDADDVWLPYKLERQAAALQRDAKVDAVLGHVQQFYSPELSDDWRARIQCSAEPQPAFHQNAMLIRRSAFERVGLFDASLEIAEFVDWYARAIHLGLNMLMQSEVVFRRRLHEKNQGITKREQRTDYVRTLKAALDRRRQQGGVVKTSDQTNR